MVARTKQRLVYDDGDSHSLQNSLGQSMTFKIPKLVFNPELLDEKISCFAPCFEVGGKFYMQLTRGMLSLSSHSETLYVCLILSPRIDCQDKFSNTNQFFKGFLVLFAVHCNTNKTKTY